MKLMCKLCRKILDNYSNESEVLGEILKEMLNVALLKPNFIENEIPVICKSCKENLYKSFEFKATCIDTEDFLYPYINTSVYEEVDMKLVYIRKRTTEKSFLFDKNDEVCRFCISLTKSKTATPLQSEILKYDKFFGKFMPELDLKTTSKAVVCKRCHVSLEKYVNFIKSQLNIIGNGQKCTDQDSEIKTNLTSHSLQSCNREIKKECSFAKHFLPKLDVCLKTEQDINIDELSSMPMGETAVAVESNEDGHYSLPIFKQDNNSIEIGKIEIKDDQQNESGIFIEEIDRKENSWQIEVVSEVSTIVKSEEISKACTTISKPMEQHKHSINFQLYCHNRNIDRTYKLTDETTSNGKCNYQAQNNLNVLETKMFKCAICTYETKYKSGLKTHMIVHKKISDIRMYKCEICDFQTKWVSCLKSHSLIHKDVSDIKMFTCELCSYQAKEKNGIRQHMFIHKNPSDIQTFQCDICSHKAKRKSALQSHMLIHKKASELKMFKCKICSFQAKQKCRLNRHNLIHSQIKMFQCAICTYRTSIKASLQSHMIIHKNPSEIEMFQCETCPFKAKRKNNLVAHSLIHKQPSEIEMFKCEICTFETKLKSYLNSHMLIHKDPSERKMSKCEICSVKTKRNWSLKKHMLVHKKRSKCNKTKSESKMLKGEIST